jgi:putative SOS response-associated peptidase YedK
MHTMCGRYSLTTPVEAVRALFGFDARPNLMPRYNIAPGQDVAAVRAAQAGAGREFAIFRWGLVPSWAKEPTIGNRMVNARAEMVASKPSFRGAYRHRRCLIIADGFYEWRRQDRGPKDPYFIMLENAAPFAFAGLWERWQSPAKDGEALETCTIVTTEANELLKPIHERMPVILEPEQFECWLTADPDIAGQLLKPYRGRMVVRRVSTLVNKAENDGPQLIEPLDPDDPPADTAMQLDLV